tara:strand:+ start:1365 stop:2429 length:1065 start_codon:yes stop_codon:yes gene_type:complete
MKEFDYVILGGGCAGLSLAYELEINGKIKNKKLAIVEIRDEYKRDRTWSFWKVFDHNFDDCVIKSWNNFSINSKSGSHEVLNKEYPYQTIDSGLFYKKILNQLKQNKNIEFFKNIDQLNSDNSIIFNSILAKVNYENKLWQHFKGVEIETTENIFDDEIFNLMDFDCDQRDVVHFFYTLPFAKNKALIETTWLSKMDDNSLKDYDMQLEKYIKETLKIKNYKINFQEQGAIPLFFPSNKIEKNKINIGSNGGMTRLSTGYTFLNIQDHSKYIANNIENIKNIKPYNIGKKYEFLDNIFLNVLKKHPDKMPKIFLNMFKAPSKTVIKFLSNKSNIFEDLAIILKMPKWIFIKNIF